jgi:hypothetical protein
MVLAHCPNADAVTTEHFVLENFDCPTCPVYTRHDLLGFSKIFGVRIKEAIAKVGGSPDSLLQVALVQ